MSELSGLSLQLPVLFYCDSASNFDLFVDLFVA